MTKPDDLDPILEKMLDVTPDAFGVFDPENRLVFCNQNMARVFGLDRDEALGRTHRELMHEAFHNGLGVNIESDDFEAWINDIESRQRSQPVRIFESDAVSGRWHKITQVTIDNYMVLVSTDISELKQTEYELRKAMDDLHHAANTDPLTLIANRRHFFEVAGVELARAQRYHHPLSLLLLDIDHFKNINDQYGHHAGDQVLKFFAAFYRDNLRKVDFIARFGGEEFVVLLPETGLSEAAMLADRLRSRLADERIYTMPEDKSLTITVSTGVSLFEGAGDTIQTLLSRADEALYRAKRQGRNRCEVARPWPAAG
ncbi:diguanylate cyclase [Thalassolituus sp. LLYu03]|uniref:sensor domain-containing diguanylate cyclase n=1 Tax=Thalassolituus sp. LLYu03 TaxID=3421656 RepID=UPI003D2A8008